MNQFAEFNNYINSPVAVYKDELYNLPFNMNTFSKMWNIRTPQEAKEIIENSAKRQESQIHRIWRNRHFFLAEEISMRS